MGVDIISQSGHSDAKIEFYAGSHASYREWIEQLSIIGGSDIEKVVKGCWNPFELLIRVSIEALDGEYDKDIFNADECQILFNAFNDNWHRVKMIVESYYKYYGSIGFFHIYEQFLDAFILGMCSGKVRISL